MYHDQKPNLHQCDKRFMYLLILISKFTPIYFQADLGSPLICKIDSQLHIVGILKPGPEDEFKNGHNYFINVLLYESWIRNASHLHIETSEEFEKIDEGYMNKRMIWNSYQTFRPSFQQKSGSPGHIWNQGLCLKLLFFILFCIITSIQ